MTRTGSAPERSGGERVEDRIRLRRALSGINRALAELREMEIPEQLFDAASRTSVQRCGFDRAIVFTVAGNQLIAQSVCFGDDEGWAARTLRVGQAPEGRPQLDEFIVETELVRRRTAAIIADAQNDPHTPRALVDETKTRNYIAAPIVCESRVVGFIHADHYFSGEAVDEIDRDVLAAFAGGVGLILERQFLRRNLQRQRAHLTKLARELDTLAGTATVVDTRVAYFEPGDGSGRGGDREPRRETLSAREREVIDLLVDGATNAAIARRLFISESTAKAHVHHILKKLGATNRAEAVSKFLRSAS